MEEKPKIKKDGQKTALYIIAIILILVALKLAESVLLPLVFAFFIFLLFNPMLNRMEKLKIPRYLGVLIVMILLLVFLFLAGWFFFFSVDRLVQSLPMYIRRFSVIDGWLSQQLDLESGTSFLSFLNFDWSGIILSSLSSLSGRAITIISRFGLIYIFVLFLLLERQSLIPKLKVAIPDGKGMKVAVMFERINRQISRYLLLKALISAVTGILFYLACLATGLDFALVWGVLAFIFNFIPSIGSIIITSLTVVLALLQFFPSWANIIYVAILMISIQMVLGNILDPRIQGIQLNLSPIVILVSLTLWGFLWGIAGMFLAVPITSILQIVCANVKSLKPFAVLIGSGRSYRRVLAQEQKRNMERAKRRDEREKRRLARTHNSAKEPKV
ncbi:MAG: AI-2E family transporter [Sphaerochaetaceae bacterium]|nr:AI-2E family transporter [Sphaerochaetaceae bacterium]MDC7248161.1 AI-2E family transporter [Sphaerochaetaceae bacterium]